MKPNTHTQGRAERERRAEEELAIGSDAGGGKVERINEVCAQSNANVVPQPAEVRGRKVGNRDRAACECKARRLNKRVP